MKAEHLTKYLHYTKHIKPILLRGTNQLCQTSVNCHFSTRIKPYRPEKKEAEQRLENKAPIRRLRAVEGNGASLFMQSGLGGPCVTQVRGDQSAAFAAAANSKSLLESVMALGRRRSQSFSFTRQHNMQCPEFATNDLEAKASSKAKTPPVPMNRLSPESELIFRAYGLKRRSESVPPNRLNGYIEPLPRNQQSLGLSQTASNNQKFDFGDDGLMTVDANLKQRLVFRPTKKLDNTELGYDSVGGAGAGVHLQSMPVVYPKSNSQKNTSNYFNLSNRLGKFQNINFADGPVSSTNFDRGAQQHQDEDQEKTRAQVERYALDNKKVPRSHPPVISHGSSVREGQTSGNDTQFGVARIQDDHKASSDFRGKSERSRFHWEPYEGAKKKDFAVHKLSMAPAVATAKKSTAGQIDEAFAMKMSGIAAKQSSKTRVYDMSTKVSTTAKQSNRTDSSTVKGAKQRQLSPLESQSNKKGTLAVDSKKWLLPENEPKKSKYFPIRPGVRPEMAYCKPPKTTPLRISGCKPAETARPDQLHQQAASTKPSRQVAATPALPVKNEFVIKNKLKVTNSFNEGDLLNNRRFELPTVKTDKKLSAPEKKSDKKLKGSKIDSDFFGGRLYEDELTSGGSRREPANESPLAKVLAAVQRGM